MAESNQTIHHVAVGILVDNSRDPQRILISKRPSDKARAGFWEFPGGKIEEGESPEEAMIRELQEEIGVKALQFNKCMQYIHEYTQENYKVILEVFLVYGFEGKPKSLEQQEFCWITLEEAGNYPFLEPNKVILKRLPSFLEVVDYTK